MEKAGEILKTILGALWNFVLFIVVSAVFLPSFFVVTYLQDYWSKKLGELFGV